MFATASFLNGTLCKLAKGEERGGFLSRGNHVTEAKEVKEKVTPGESQTVQNGGDKKVRTSNEADWLSKRGIVLKSSLALLRKMDFYPEGYEGYFKQVL